MPRPGSFADYKDKADRYDALLKASIKLKSKIQTWEDHACKMCFPHESGTIDGFVCAWHTIDKLEHEKNDAT